MCVTETVFVVMSTGAQIGSARGHAKPHAPVRDATRPPATPDSEQHLDRKGDLSPYIAYPQIALIISLLRHLSSRLRAAYRRARICNSRTPVGTSEGRSISPRHGYDDSTSGSANTSDHTFRCLDRRPPAPDSVSTDHHNPLTEAAHPVEALSAPFDSPLASHIRGKGPARYRTTLQITQATASTATSSGD
jgi:hypothetical protein